MFGVLDKPISHPKPLRIHSCCPLSTLAACGMLNLARSLRISCSPGLVWADPPRSWAFSLASSCPGPGTGLLTTLLQVPRARPDDVFEVVSEEEEEEEVQPEDAGAEGDPDMQEEDEDNDSSSEKGRPGQPDISDDEDKGSWERGPGRGGQRAGRGEEGAGEEGEQEEEEEGEEADDTSDVQEDQELLEVMIRAVKPVFGLGETLRAESKPDTPLVSSGHGWVLLTL